ncbi:sensor histidine kinase [Pseudoduganella umbonata]|uniref:histidine kinase n=1 Tax=Pseudoduganella umbonata TaxID=864828 RepID=A0A4P8HM67_9BURK|nr:histidine kinase [Pseudoduganella umbonata]MBB3219330.1 signal transduction histidine kinase [Pseudoduganella umbonata]QCP09432.1 histidine kinase [Pseudoduganella umbonata]
MPDKITPGDERAAELSDLLGHVVTNWDNDRRALARQLHDSLGSSLTALTMHLGLLTAKLQPDQQPLRDRAAQMKNLLHTIIENNRQMQHKLWNDKLEFLGMKVAFAELVTQFAQQYALVARCSLPEEEPVCPREYGVVLLRVLEQGLSNVTAHSGATEVDVIVDDNEDEIMLTVRDNGKGGGRGLAPDAPAGTGQYGLRLLRERARLLGGVLTLATHPEGGAVLTVVLPKPPAA